MTRARDTADLLTLAPDSQALEPDTAMPFILNGAMMVCQRATSAPSLSSGNHKVLDTWNFSEGSDNAVVTMSQVTDGPTGSGFKKSLKIDCTTASGTVGANDVTKISQRHEGINCRAFRKGYSDAKKITLAFWVKSTKTGTFIAELFDHPNDRACSQAYTVSSSNTWEKKVLNFPADTSSDKLTFDEAKRFEITWILLAGTDYTSGTLQTTWADTVNANRYVGQVDALDSTDNNWQITGVQLEIGEYTATTIPPFRHIPFALDLLRCQRYFMIKADGDSQFFEMGGMQSGSLANGFTQGPCRMRNAPTVSVADGTDYFSFRSDNGDRTSNSLNGAGSRHGPRIQNIFVSGLTVTQGYGGFFRTNNASAFVHFSSDL